jgi:hypothetical protein
MRIDNEKHIKKLKIVLKKVCLMKKSDTFAEKLNKKWQN